MWLNGFFSLQTPSLLKKRTALIYAYTVEEDEETTMEKREQELNLQNVS